MEGKRHGQESSILPKLIPAIYQFGSKMETHSLDRKYFNAFLEEQSIAEEHFKRNKEKTPKIVDLWIDSDEELKSELENAVKQYKENVKKNKPTETSNHQRKSKKEKSQKVVKEKTKTKVTDATDVQELINYFFLQEKDKDKGKTQSKTYADYERQGAIPKNIAIRGKLDRSSSESEITQEGVKSKKDKDKNNVQKVSQPGVKDLECISIKKADSDEIIIKISEESCSRPFYYIVPENPSPNFFLPRGSYYVIPKTPSSTSDNRIFFHPENTTQEPAFTPGLKPPQNNRMTSQICTNNLGKEVPEKVDSHLNIGPVDVKISDSNNNLESNCKFDKNFDKNLLSSDRWEVEPAKDGQEVGNSIRGEETSSEAEAAGLRQLDKILQTLLSEFPTLDADSAKTEAEKYLYDEDGLRSFINSARLEQKIEQQLERMILSLPETNVDELREKCNEFQGDEDLVSDYIKETLQDYKIRQKVLDLQFVLPDADPVFLRQLIERLNGDDDEFNILTDELLDNKDYPKISEDSSSAERRRWWKTLVEKFNVKNYILQVPNPGDFAGDAGDNNKENYELIIKFLQSRYPSLTRDYLINTFESNYNNVTKTCESLKELPPIRLAESSFRKEAFSEKFLEEIIYIDRKKEIDEYLKEMKERKEIEAEEARLNNSFLFCPLCSEDELIVSEAICCLDGHLFCKDCIKRYVFVKISEGIFEFVCPLENCDTTFSLSTLQEILPESVLSNIINKQQAEEISKAKVDGLECCPFCEFAYIPNPEDKIFKCQNSACLIETCRKCHERNHIPLRCEEIERKADVEARKKIEESMTQELVRVCPTCLKKFVKIDGCNKMVCVCGTVMCYICRKQVEGYDHFSKYTTDQKCPLFSNNEDLHSRQVFEAGIRTREEILEENQDIRILHDPTVTRNEI